jgi:hypothetical protein
MATRRRLCTAALSLPTASLAPVFASSSPPWRPQSTPLADDPPVERTGHAKGGAPLAPLSGGPLTVTDLDTVASTIRDQNWMDRDVPRASDLVVGRLPHGPGAARDRRRSSVEGYRPDW